MDHVHGATPHMRPLTQLSCSSISHGATALVPATISDVYIHKGAILATHAALSKQGLCHSCKRSRDTTRLDAVGLPTSLHTTPATHKHVYTTHVALGASGSTYAAVLTPVTSTVTARDASGSFFLEIYSV